MTAALAQRWWREKRRNPNTRSSAEGPSSQSRGGGGGAQSMRNLALGSLLEREDTEWIAKGQKGPRKSSASDVEFEK